VAQFYEVQGMTVPVYDIVTRIRDILQRLERVLDDLQNELDRQASDRKQEVDSDERP